MIRLYALLAAAVLASLATSASEAPKAPIPLFPTTVGTKWVYDLDGEEVTELLTAVQVKDGVHYVFTGRVVEEGRVRPWEKLWVTDWAIFRMEFEGVKQSPPVSMVVLPLGPKAGVKTVEVTVPAGKFTTYPCTTYTAMKPPLAATLLILDETRYYAPGVGVVKVETGVTSKPKEKSVLSTKVLKKFVRAAE